MVKACKAGSSISDLSWHKFTLALSKRTHIMGVLNRTPDSFSDGGQFFDVDEAVGHGLKMVEEGAAIVDVGAESTRPGAGTVSVTF